MKRKLLVCGIIGCILLLGVTFIKKVTLFNSYFSIGKLNVLRECIDEAYLYEVDELALEEGIYSGYLTGLENADTYYLTASEMKALNDEIEELTIHPLEEDCVYIKINAIREGTSKKLKQALSHKKGLILDLRNLDIDNMEEVQKISDLFLEKEIIFKLETKETGMQAYETTEGSSQIPIVLIMNQETRSGSEALILALEERAMTVGNTTCGDPYIKKNISFEDGTGMSIAYGKLYDRYGRVLEAITPDEEVILSKEEVLDLLKQEEITLLQDPFIKVALQKFNEARIIDKD